MMQALRLAAAIPGVVLLAYAIFRAIGEIRYVSFFVSTLARDVDMAISGVWARIGAAFGAEFSAAAAPSLTVAAALALIALSALRAPGAAISLSGRVAASAVVSLLVAGLVAFLFLGGDAAPAPLWALLAGLALATAAVTAPKIFRPRTDPSAAHAVIGLVLLSALAAPVLLPAQTPSLTGAAWSAAAAIGMVYVADTALLRRRAAAVIGLVLVLLALNEASVFREHF